MLQSWPGVASHSLLLLAPSAGCCLPPRPGPACCRTMLGLLGLGSVSSEVVKQAHCSVMIHKAQAA